jgi:superfamily II DNA/RNA helicase
MATLDAFREGRITFLAASDVAARGLDIPDVSHIFNFDVPWQHDDYVHRIGRTGRAGKEGRSLTIVTPLDFKLLGDIERMLGAPVTWIGDAPSAEDIASAKRRRGRGGRGGRPSPGRHESRGHRGRNGAHRPERNGVAAHNGHDDPPALAAADQPAQAAQHQERGERRPPRQDSTQPGEERARQGRGNRRPHRGERSADAKSSNQPPPAKRAPRQAWEPRPPRQPDRGREDRGPAPVGLGDHVPAFLKKTTRSAQR